ncbi:activator-dependent family glycosyltransferase [Streptomyces sp. NPDC002845]
MIAAWPSTTHIYPLVPIAWALQSAGHEVRVATYPTMAEAVTGAGLTAVQLGEAEELPPTPLLDKAKLAELTSALNLSPDEGLLWEFFGNRILPVLSKFYPGEPAHAGDRPMVDDLVDFARSWKPDLVLWDASFYAGAVAARACGAAHARLMIGVDYWAWSREIVRERMGPQRSDPILELIQPMVERFGFAADDEMMTGQWTVDPTPPRMQLPIDVRFVPVRPVPYNGAVTVPQWLHESPVCRRVCLTVGLSGRERLIASGIPLSELLEQLAELDIEVVATLNSDQLDTSRKLPDNVRPVEYLPLDLLLPTCSAVIHHGGPGTFGAAVASKVPQLITGALSSWDNGASGPAAKYVVDRGAGLALERDQFSVDALKSQLMRILDEPTFQDGCTQLHEDMLASPSPADIVPVLERLTALHRS